MLLLCKLLAVASCRNPITSCSCCCCPHGWLPPVCTTIRMLRLLSLLRWLLVRPKLLVLLPRLRLAASCDTTAVDALQAACATAETHRSSRAAPVLVACAAGSRPSTCSLRHVRLISAWALSASAAAVLVPSGCSRITAWAASAATRSRSRALEGWPDLQKRRSWCWLLPLNTAATAASSTSLLGSASTTMGRLYSLLWLSACAWLSCLRRDRACRFQLRTTTARDREAAATAAAAGGLVALQRRRGIGERGPGSTADKKGQGQER